MHTSKANQGIHSPFPMDTCSTEEFQVKHILIHLPETIFSFNNVLVWAEVEFIFFIVATMGLCFGFVLRTVLITQGCFCYC